MMMRAEPRRMAERLGLDQRTIRWLEANGHVQRLALTEPEIRARLYHAHLAYLRLEPAAGAIARRSAIHLESRHRILNGDRG